MRSLSRPCPRRAPAVSGAARDEEDEDEESDAETLPPPPTTQMPRRLRGTTATPSPRSPRRSCRRRVASPSFACPARTPSRRRARCSAPRPRQDATRSGEETRWCRTRRCTETCRDPRDGKVIDEVLVLPMLAPRSYTTEDVVEIHAHGGSVCVQRVLSLLLRNGDETFERTRDDDREASTTKRRRRTRRGARRGTSRVRSEDRRVVRSRAPRSSRRVHAARVPERPSGFNASRGCARRGVGANGRRRGRRVVGVARRPRRPGAARARGKPSSS